MRFFEPSAVRLIALAAWLGLAAAVRAGEPVPHATVEGVTEYRLPNGLRVLTVPDASVDTVTVHITYLVGSRHEGYGEKGMAHLLEHLLFKGTAKFPDVKEELTRRGARWNGTTSTDRTTYFQTLAATDENLAWAIEMEADRMVNAKLRREDLASEMTVVRNEFEMGENDPVGVLFKRMLRLVYSWHNYGHAVIGNRADIEAVPIERLRAFYRTWYRPDNAVLILAGRFDEARARALVARHFGALARPPEPLPALYTTEPVQDGERSVTLRRAGETPVVAAMYRIPSGADVDYADIALLVHVLAATPGGRLHRALVQRGLASAVWGGERAAYDPGFAYFGAALPKGASPEAAREALVAVLEGVARDPIRDDELERARAALRKQFERAHTQTAVLVRWLAEFSALGDWRLFFLYRDRLERATRDDVQRAAQRYFRRDARVLGTFLPTDHPERADIPPRPDVAARVEGYRGREALAQGESFDPSPQNIERRLLRRTLANGIRVTLLPKKTRGERVHVVLNLYWGDEQSKQGRAIACSLAGEMLLRGTRSLDRLALQERLDRLGSSVSASLESVEIETRRGALDETLALVVEALRAPAFAASEFEELRRVLIASAESQASDPEVLAREHLQRHLSPYPAGHWLEPLTSEARIAALRRTTLAEARRCHEELVGATGAHFVAVGDFDPEALVARLEALLADWRSPAPFRRVPQQHFDRPPLDEELRTPDKANAVLKAGLTIALRDDHADFPALVLGVYLLGGNASARLPARVREREGLSYSTYAVFSASALDPLASFSISAIYAPQNKQRVEQAIREELERALRDGFGADEVEAAKKSLLEARRLARANDRQLAARLARYSFLGRRLDWDAESEARIAALSPEAVRAALARNIDPRRLAWLKAGDLR